MKQRNRFKRRLIGWGITFALLLSLFTFLMIWFFGASYPVYDQISRNEFAIPGLTAIAPQGVCALPENQFGYDFATSGYMTDGTPSRIYLVNRKTGDSKYITVEEKGKLSTAHFGGVSCTQNYLLVASGKRVLRIPLKAACEAENGQAVSVYDALRTNLNVAYCYVAGDTLYAGEFYRAGNYETDVSHHRAVAGGTNYAYIYAYRVDESQAGGVASSTPEKALSVREQVQGIAVYEGGITLSTSYGLADSLLFTYENPLNGQADGTASVDGAEVPLYELDGDNLINTLVAPCMSEEICEKDGRLYILYESLCDKYRFFTSRRIAYVQSIATEELTKRGG